ncbi:MAG TPA: hypothetical protein VFJ18_07350 [Pararhizobium sp.]|nr:hypothetical protein [Pararhizobium sp.]
MKFEAVECGGCGWTGRRKPGNLVQCPKCGEFAGFQMSAFQRQLFDVDMRICEARRQGAAVERLFDEREMILDYRKEKTALRTDREANNRRIRA